MLFHTLSRRGIQLLGIAGEECGSSEVWDLKWDETDLPILPESWGLYEDKMQAYPQEQHKNGVWDETNKVNEVICHGNIFLNTL